MPETVNEQIYLGVTTDEDMKAYVKGKYRCRYEGKKVGLHVNVHLRTED